MGGADKERAAAVLSQVKLVVRPMYSSPPKQGAALVAKVLNDPKLKAQWMSELKEMSDRIVKMRNALRKRLEELKTPGTWNHHGPDRHVFVHRLVGAAVRAPP